MKVIISMSGMSSRFTNAGYTVPKFMIEVDGKTVIQHIVDLYPQDSEFLFIINDDHAKDMELCHYLDELDIDRLSICSVPVHKKGPVYSVEQYQHHIEDDEQVIINYCDFSMDWDYDDFEKFVNETECDGCVVCYTGFHPHMLGGDNYAFCKVDKDNTIEEIREKQPFTDDKMSEFASSGTYYFKKGSYVKKYFRELMEKEITVNNEYYVSMVYNLLIEDGLINKVYEVPHMLQWGTPLDLAEYQQWSKYYNRVIEGQTQTVINNCVTALRMAGWGNRFAQAGYRVPKPCIQVNGHYMMDQALKCLPKTATTVLGALTRHKDLLPLSDYGHVVWMDEVLSGQACTTERIVSEISDPDQSILVSACDNGMLYDGRELQWILGNDVIVWTFRNNYTTYRNPNAYSWVELDDDGYVKQLHVKDFKWEDPLKEHAVTGTFWFRNKDVYTKSLSQLYTKNNRVNNEFYIDSLVNEAIELGYKVKHFEIDHYVCWGTPNDLQTYQYWQRFFNKVDWHRYTYEKDYFTN